MALKTTSWLATAALLITAAIGGWWLNRTPGANAPSSANASPGAPAPAGAAFGGPPAVEVATVRAMTLVDDVSAVGSLRSRQSVMLRPEVSGRVAKLAFRDGERVRRGQLLVQLDDSLQKAQLQQAKAQATIARTNLERSRELLAQSFVSQSAVDQNLAALEVAQAQVALADAQLARMAILAPFDAVAGIRIANVGDYLKDGADIVTLDDLSAVLVDFRLPERYLPQLRVGLAIDLSLDALPGRAFKGVVEALDTQLDANGRSLLVRARVDNPGALLKPGMFARPRVVFSRRENALVVPEEALVPMGAQQVIYLVSDADGTTLARRVEARLGLRLPGRVELLAGVKAGDRVVTAGQTRLRGEAMPVRVIDTLAGAPPPAGPDSGASAGTTAATAAAASASVQAAPLAKPVGMAAAASAPG